MARIAHTLMREEMHSGCMSFRIHHPSMLWKYAPVFTWSVTHERAVLNQESGLSLGDTIINNLRNVDTRSDNSILWALCFAPRDDDGIRFRRMLVEKNLLRTNVGQFGSDRIRKVLQEHMQWSLEAGRQGSSKPKETFNCETIGGSESDPVRVFSDNMGVTETDEKADPISIWWMGLIHRKLYGIKKYRTQLCHFYHTSTCMRLFSSISKGSGCKKEQECTYSQTAACMMWHVPANTIRACCGNMHRLFGLKYGHMIPQGAQLSY